MSLSQTTIQRWQDAPIATLQACLEALVEQHRAAFRRPITLGVALLEGERFVIDTKSAHVVTAWREDTDLVVLTNRRTLADWLIGLFDPSQANAAHVFIWSGDRVLWQAFGAALGKRFSVTSVRLQNQR